MSFMSQACLAGPNAIHQIHLHSFLPCRSTCWSPPDSTTRVALKWWFWYTVSNQPSSSPTSWTVLLAHPWNPWLCLYKYQLLLQFPGSSCHLLSFWTSEDFRPIWFGWFWTYPSHPRQLSTHWIGKTSDGNSVHIHSVQDWFRNCLHQLLIELLSFCLIQEPFVQISILRVNIVHNGTSAYSKSYIGEI